MNVLNWMVSGLLVISMNAQAEDEADWPVKITKTLSSVVVEHKGKPMEIMRDQDTGAMVDDNFARTSRECPPFCVQPMHLAPGVETIGELELLDYLSQHQQGDKNIVVIDSRTPDWHKRGSIPGAINISWKLLSPKHSSEDDIAEILEEQFGAIRGDALWDFSYAKTLVMFCNGMWCGQSPTNILDLLRMGYPPNKIKWYRGGMQNWYNLGFTVVDPDED